MYAGLQLIQGKLADMYTVTAATRAFVYKTAAEADAGRADRKDCAAVILYAAEHATRMALDAIQVCDILLVFKLMPDRKITGAAVVTVMSSLSAQACSPAIQVLTVLTSVLCMLLIPTRDIIC